jgi:DNA polymerase III subunit alpha
MAGFSTECRRLKGVGSNAIDKIVEDRKKNGPFGSIFDFSSRIDTRVCNRRTIESLIKAGAFDELHQNRAQLLESIEDILSYAARKQEEDRLNQASLFGDISNGGMGMEEPKLRECEPWSNIMKLNKERELIGFYLSGHPLDKYKEDIRLFSSHTLVPGTLQNLADKSNVRIVGIITSVKRLNDRKGRPFAFLTLEDLEGVVEAITFNDVYDGHLGMIQTDTIVMLEGHIDKRDDQPKIIVKSIERVENLREKYQDQLQLNLKIETDMISKDELSQMAALFSLHKGNTPIRIMIHSKEAENPIPMNVRKYVVEPSSELLGSLRNLIGEESVGLVRSPG